MKTSWNESTRDTPITSRVTANYSLLNAFFYRGLRVLKMCMWLNRIKHPVLLCFNNFKYTKKSITRVRHPRFIFTRKIHLHRFNPNLITHFLLRLLCRRALRGVMNDFDLTIYTNIRQIKTLPTFKHEQQPEYTQHYLSRSGEKCNQLK
jgi:hypothetical protein